MLTRKTRRASRLSLGTRRAGSAQRPVSGRRCSKPGTRGLNRIPPRPMLRAFEAAPAISGPASLPRVMPNGKLRYPPRPVAGHRQSPSTRVALRHRDAAVWYGRQSSNSQDMAQKVVLGIGRRMIDAWSGPAGARVRKKYPTSRLQSPHPNR